MRNENGRFAAGHRESPETEFKKGTHRWPRKQYWDRDWLHEHYIVKKMSAQEIADISGCHENSILNWLAKHGIPKRNVSEARAIKHWGLSGEKNGMYGKFGEQNPRYIDGSSPERQKLYARSEHKAFIKRVLKRDNYRCVRCNATNTGPKTLHVHHLRSWAGNESLRFEMSNVVTLCKTCHDWVHSKANTEREYIL